MSPTRTLAAALTIAALAVPAAQAQPADMRASVAQALAQKQQKQDLRSADARDAGTIARHPRSPGHAGQAVNAPGATAVDSATRPGLPGPPTWPTNPQPITSAPAAEVTDAPNGIGWTTIGLGIVGSLLAVGGLAVLNNRRDRRTQRARAVA